MKKILLVSAIVFAAAVSFCVAQNFHRLPAGTIDDRVKQFGGVVAKRWQPFFAAADLSYPPARAALIGLKSEKRLEVYAATATGTFRFVRSIPILAASGGPGPKLCEGDGQVPEGLYGIELLNPNSRFHLSLRINYPNESDRRHGGEDGRKNLGGDIMIHGNAVSIGCIAIGDEAAEDVFVLAAKTGIKNISVILAPADFRKRKFSPPVAAPPWTGKLYESIRAALAIYPQSQ